MVRSTIISAMLSLAAVCHFPAIAKPGSTQEPNTYDYGSCLQMVSPPLTNTISPLERMRERAESTFKLSQENDNIKLGNMEIAKIRVNLERNRRFFQTVMDQSLRMSKPCQERIIAIDAFLAELPSDIMNLELEREDFFRKELSPSELALSKWSELFQRFTKFQNEVLKHSEFVRSLRDLSNNVLNSTEVQNALMDVIVDSLEHLVQQAVIISKDPTARGNKATSIFGILDSNDFRHGNRGSHSLDFKNSDFYSVKMSRHLLSQMLLELFSNASEASLRRHPQLNPTPQNPFNWDLAQAHVRLKKDSSGNGLIEIEDFGDPQEFMRTSGIGNSTRQGNGFGIGRFRAKYLADFLGVKLTLFAKLDGSGSIVTVIIPKELITEKDP